MAARHRARPGDAALVSAMLGAVEALQSGTTAIIDHHESPNAIEGSLDVIADACAEVGVRVSCAVRRHRSYTAHDARACRGLAENERFLRAGGRGMVGVHAAFTCQTTRSRRPPIWHRRLGVGVHIHVAEGIDDIDAGARLAVARRRRLAARALRPPRPAVARHHRPQPAQQHEQRRRLRRARPTRPNPVVLGTDGIGADMLEEFRLAYVALRADDVTATPDTVWAWLDEGYRFFPEARDDRVTWNYDHADSPWHVAFTPGMRALDVVDRTARCCCATACRRASTSTRCAPRRPSRRPAVRRGSDAVTGYDPADDRRRSPTVPVALYLQDAHPITEGIELVRYAEQQGFDAVWQADSRLVRDAVVPMAAFAAATSTHQDRQRRHRHLDPQPGAARQHVLDARRSRARPDHLRARRVVGSAGQQGRHRPRASADGDARGRHRRARAAGQRDRHLRRRTSRTSTASSWTTCTRSAGRRTCRSTSARPACR